MLIRIDIEIREVVKNPGAKVEKFKEENSNCTVGGLKMRSQWGDCKALVPALY